MTHRPDPTGFYRALAETPYRFGFHAVLRRLEGLWRQHPRLGHADRRRDEPVRLAQAPSMAFAPATLASFSPPRAPEAPPALSVRFFGLWGPAGPMPLHLTELARERARRSPPDPTLAAFADVFHHRLLCLLHRAWVESEPAVSRDRPGDEDRHGHRVAALAGGGTPATRDRDPRTAEARRAAAAYLVGGVRTADRLAGLLEVWLDVPVRVTPWACRWFVVPEGERCRLDVHGTRPGACLGQGAVLGARVLEADGRIDVALGPLSLTDHEGLAPGGARHAELRTALDAGRPPGLSVRVRLMLRRDQVPAPRLATTGFAVTGTTVTGSPITGSTITGSAIAATPRLGRSLWLGRRATPSDPDDLRWTWT